MHITDNGVGCWCYHGNTHVIAILTYLFPTAQSWKYL